MHYRLDVKTGDTTKISVEDYVADCKQGRVTKQIGRALVGKICLSTVFLGLDHGWGGQPVLFETMMFGGPLDQVERRYHTLKQAQKGHNETLWLVEALKKTQGMSWRRAKPILTELLKDNYWGQFYRQKSYRRWFATDQYKAGEEL